MLVPVIVVLLVVVDSAKISVENETYEQVEQIGYDTMSSLFATPVWDTLRLTSNAYVDDKGGNVPQISLFFEIALIFN